MKFTSFAIVAFAAAPAFAGRYEGTPCRSHRRNTQRSTDGKGRFRAGSLRAVVKPERRLTSNIETKDDLKKDYEVKKKVCSELNECLKRQTEQVGKLYETLQESEEPVSPTLYDTLCFSDGQSGDAGIVVVADTTRFDQVLFCQKSLSAECEFRKKEAELEGKMLFIELKEVVDCDSLDELPCLNDYSFDKRELTFVKANFFPIMDNDFEGVGYGGPDYYTCDDLPFEFSEESEYLGTPLLAYDPTEVFDYCGL